MARGPVCTYCETKLVGDETFCAGCGHPTDRASRDERVLWELGQWESSRSRAADALPQSKREASSARAKALADSVRHRAANTPEKPAVPAGELADSPHRRSFASRFRRAGPPDAAPAPAQPAAKARSVPATQAPRRRPAEQRPAAARPAAASPKPAKAPAPKAPAVKAAPAPKVAPPRQVAAASAPRPATPARQMSATATAPALAPEATPEVETRPRPNAAPAPSERPLVTIRRSSEDRTRSAPQDQRAPTAATVHAPPQPVKTKPARAPKPERAPKPARAPKSEKVKDRRREAEKRERKHRRHSKRVTRRAASLDLKDGERVSLSIEGWSRFRRATLVVTNYRVALITRVPPAVRWIPLEEVSTITRRWQGAWSVVVMAPTEVLTLQKSKGQMLASFKALLEAEVKEARTIGSDRHHADITQDWVERASMIWDSRWQRFRLWVRRHPLVNVIAFAACLTGGLYLLSVLTAAFSPVR